MELWDLYDAEGNLVEGKTLERGQTIPIEYRHLVAEVVVQHVDGTYLLMKRAHTKASYPGFWEIGAGGSAMAGETSADAAIRELKEETGISVNTLMQVDRTITHDSIYDNYLAVTDCDKDGIVLEPEETVDYKWISKDELTKFFYTYQCIYRQRRNLADFMSKIVDFRLIALRDHPEYQPLTADWLEGAIGGTKEGFFNSMQEGRQKDKVIPQWYIAMEGYRLIGCVGILEDKDTPGLPSVAIHYVEKDCRDRGVGRAILDYAERDAKSRGVERIRVLTKSVGYYEKLGWKYVGNHVKKSGKEYRVYEK